MKVQKHLDMCDEKSLPNERRLFHELSVLPMSMTEVGRVLSKVKRTLNYWRSTMSEGGLEALFLMKAYRENPPYTSEVVYYFGISGTHNLPFKLNM